MNVESYRFGFDPGLENPWDADVVEISPSDEFVRVPGGNFVLHASYERLGPDLMLTGEGYAVLLKDYFTQETYIDLLSTDGGSVISGALAHRLAGPLTPGQFAQAESNGQMASVIGQVETIEGSVSLTRLNGVTVVAEKGTEVFLGDIVETGADGVVGLTFIDDTVFALGEDARMVIDELVYEPDEDSGTSVFTVVEGTFSFVSGKIAGTGDDAMVVELPVATIGIRGTKVVGKAAVGEEATSLNRSNPFEGEGSSITLLPEADGSVGQITVTNNAGSRVMNQPFQTTEVRSAFASPTLPKILPESTISQLYGSVSDIVTAITLPQSSALSDDRDDDVSSQSEATAGGREESEEVPEGERESEDPEGSEGEEGGEELEEAEGELEALGEEEGFEGEGPPLDGQEGEGLPPEGQEGEGLPPEGQEEGGERLPPGAEELPSEGQEGLRSEGRTRKGEGPQDGDGEEEGRQPREFEVAREAFDQAIESGATEEEAFRAAATAVGQEEIYEQAIADGIREDDALRIARDSARGEEDRFFRSDEQLIGTAQEELTKGLANQPITGRETRQVISDAIRETGADIRAIQATEEAAHTIVHEAFHDYQKPGNTPPAITNLFTSDDSPISQLFGDSLRRGSSIEKAFQDLEKSLQGGKKQGEPDYRLQDHLESSAIIRAFDPFLVVITALDNTIGEFRQEAELTEGTITKFAETVEGSLLSEELKGSANDTRFVLNQGSSLGGNDTFSDAGGQDQVTFGRLNDIILIFDGASSILKYSNFDGSVSGTVDFKAASIEQIFVSDLSGTEQRLLFDVDGEVGTGIILVGTNAADSLSLKGDGTTAVDITFGTLSEDLDASDIFGAIILGSGGDDKIIGSIGEDILRGGPGNDTITSNGNDFIFGDGGDDTFVFQSPSDLINNIISGSTNSSQGGDTIQLGDSSTSQGQTFNLSPNEPFFNDISGIEILDIIPSNTTVIGDVVRLFSLSEILTSTGSTGNTILSKFETLNLSNTSISSGVTSLKATSIFSSGVRIFDGNDDGGRNIFGSNGSNPDELFGFRGDDVFQTIGTGNDTIVGGPGNDTIIITSANDLTGRKTISGGPGTDTLKLDSTEVTSLVLDDKSFFTTLESIDLTGGSPNGVSFSIQNASQISNGIVGVTISGDGANDSLILRRDGNDFQQKTIFDGINAISLTDTKTPRTMEFSSDTSFVNVTTVTITGANIVGGGLDTIRLSTNDLNANSTPSFDFSGFTLTNIEVNARVPVQSIIGFDNSTNFGTVPLKGSFGSRDILDYKSELVLADGATKIAVSEDLNITKIESSGSKTYLTDDNNGVIDFLFSTLDVALDGSATEDALVAAVQAVLEGTNSNTNLTGLADTQVTQGGANTEQLLIFRSATSPSNVHLIVRYAEGAESEASFANELNLVAIINNTDSDIGADGIT